MIEQTIERTTFAAGVVSERLQARRDLARYQAGLAVCENFVVMLEGGLTRRPGSRFVIEQRNEDEIAKLMPFRASSAINYSILLNGGFARFLKDGGYVRDVGGTPYEIATPWTAADVANLRHAQLGTAAFMVCRGHAPRILSYTSPTSWALALYQPAGGPLDPQNLAAADTIQASATTGAITLAASTDRFVAGDVGAIWRLDEADLASVPLWKGNETINSGDQRRNAGKVYVSVSGLGVSAGVNPPDHDEGDASSGSGNVIWRYLHAGYGFVRVTAFTDLRHVNATVLATLPTSVVAAPTYRWWPPAWSTAKGWPERVCFNDGRLCFFRGDTFWISNPIDLYDMTVNDSPDSAIVGKLRSPDGTLVDIQWALASGVLVIGTRDREWIIRGSGAYDALTNDTIRIVPDTSEGSCEHQPITVAGGAIFIGRSRRRLHYVQFDGTSERLALDEISISGRDVLDGRAAELAFQRDPHSVVWGRGQDGGLIGLTFMPKEQIIAAHRHPMTNAFIESLVALPSSDEGVSDVYMTVRRTINGLTRRFVEILTQFFEPEDRAAPTARGAWFVDCGLAYDGTPVTEISGLGHLEGQTVRVFADGALHPPRVVSGGRITLNRACSTVVAGLPVRARARMLPLELQVPGSGSTRAAMKRASHVNLDVHWAAGGTVAINAQPAEKLQLSGGQAPTAPVPLRTGRIEARVLSASATLATVAIDCDNELPFELLGVSPELAIEA